MRKIVNIITVLAVAIYILGFMILSIVMKDKDISTSERRRLEQLPELSVQTVLARDKNSFMSAFDRYSCDQFPFREGFRRIGGLASVYILGKTENNGLLLTNGYISKPEYSINSESVQWSLNRLNIINDKFLDGANVYFAVIPDKNYYIMQLSEVSYPNYEYDELFNTFSDATSSYAQFIDLRNVLELGDYYYTDTHWKQEELGEVTDYIISSMKPGAEAFDINEYKLNVVDNGFKGVYYGQIALPCSFDTITTVSGGYIDELQAWCYDSGEAVGIPVYDYEKIGSQDEYEVYLTGSKALVTIENPNCNDDRELVVFRDSFGSSIAPLLAKEYAKVTLVDIRYISPQIIGRFVDFENADVLFIYSSQILNNSKGQFIN